MSSSILSCLNNVSRFLQVPIKNLSYNTDKMVCCSISNSPVTNGFINIVIKLVQASKKDLLGRSIEDELEVLQLLEYCLIHGSNVTNQSANQILEELNKFLEIRTYFIAHQITIVDIVAYYILQEIMVNLTYQQKEKYLNVSRWFDNIQQNSSINNKNIQIDFSTLFLTSVSVR